MTRRNRKAAIALAAVLVMGMVASQEILAGTGFGNRTPPVSYGTALPNTSNPHLVEQDTSAALVVDTLVRSFLLFWIV